MERSIVQTKMDAIVSRLARLPRRPIIAGALSGVLSGIALGSYTGPVGVVLGMWIGVAVGIITGYVLANDDAKVSVRTQELDAIIGVTTGSMGARGVVQAPDEDDQDPPPYSEKESWLAEWLTPPPPVAR
jgi:hypothetical protein